MWVTINKVRCVLTYKSESPVRLALQISQKHLPKHCFVGTFVVKLMSTMFLLSMPKTSRILHTIRFYGFREWNKEKSNKGKKTYYKYSAWFNSKPRCVPGGFTPFIPRPRHTQDPHLIRIKWDDSRSQHSEHFNYTIRKQLQHSHHNNNIHKVRKIDFQEL